MSLFQRHSKGRNKKRKVGCRLVRPPSLFPPHFTLPSTAKREKRRKFTSLPKTSDLRVAFHLRVSKNDHPHEGLLRVPVPVTGDAGMVVEDEVSDDGEACGRVEDPEEYPCQHPFSSFVVFER